MPVIHIYTRDMIHTHCGLFAVTVRAVFSDSAIQANCPVCVAVATLEAEKEG